MEDNAGKQEASIVDTRSIDYTATSAYLLVIFLFSSFLVSIPFRTAFTRTLRCSSMPHPDIAPSLPQPALAASRARAHGHPLSLALSCGGRPLCTLCYIPHSTLCSHPVSF